MERIKWKESIGKRGENKHKELDTDQIWTFSDYDYVIRGLIREGLGGAGSKRKDVWSLMGNGRKVLFE